DVTRVRYVDLIEGLERIFTPVAQAKGLNFVLDLHPSLPESFETDSKRLQQILKNLLSNAFKFTEAGEVRLQISPATRGWSSDHPALSRAERVVAFAVSDTGIGIPSEKHRAIFEAFQQADGGTS